MAFTPLIMPTYGSAAQPAAGTAAPAQATIGSTSTQPRGLFGRIRGRLRQRIEQQLAAQAAEKAADEAATQPPAGAVQQQSFATAAASGQAQRTRRRAASGSSGPRMARAGRRSAAQGAIQPMGTPLILIGGGV